MSENEDIDELLYTQEDINEWMRACDELQENLLDKREIIKDLQSQLDQQKAMWNELKEFVGKYADNYDESISSICYLILDKMQSLEKGV